MALLQFNELLICFLKNCVLRAALEARLISSKRRDLLCPWKSSEVGEAYPFKKNPISFEISVQLICGRAVNNTDPACVCVYTAFLSIAFKLMFLGTASEDQHK